MIGNQRKLVLSYADKNEAKKVTEISVLVGEMTGVANIDEILDAADGIMVARGDMGVEIPFEQIPAI